ncbi:hypothetical protein CgunFtcFv8_010704 [Champsocephalus gunnari]|uniref:Uncharacterized protein n=1 Tax=Champsocephalus gunnari TaxID=52237 RepID=A0AAN8DVG4_CHAGU|nr:hypothetical protein CgunFtcFv8_010704 [Champsocephalus gunnari]
MTSSLSLLTLLRQRVLLRVALEPDWSTAQRLQPSTYELRMRARLWHVEQSDDPDTEGIAVGLLMISASSLLIDSFEQFSTVKQPTRLTGYPSTYLLQHLLTYLHHPALTREPLQCHVLNRPAVPRHQSYAWLGHVWGISSLAVPDSHPLAVQVAAIECRNGQFRP